MRRNTILGLFVVIGTLIFVAVLYFLADQRSFFGSNVKVHALFKNVSGLQKGNNVQFSGIAVGTVRELAIVDDSNVRVTMYISKDVSQFIKEDSKASIGSEGLMGNRVVVISAGSPSISSIESGDTLPTVEPVAMEDIMNDLAETGEHARSITSDLAEVTAMIKRGEGAAGLLLADTAFEERINNTFVALENSGEKLSKITNDFARISEMTSRGEGTLGKLLVDETIAQNFTEAIDSMKVAGAKSVEATDNLVEFTEKLNNTEGTLGRLLTDTTMADTIDETITSANEGAEEFEILVKRVRESGLMNFLFGTRKDN